MGGIQTSFSVFIHLTGSPREIMMRYIQPVVFLFYLTG